MRYVPEICSGWRPLFKPEKFGHYVNDHCLIQDRWKHWHLFGITSLDEGPDLERYFVHASNESESLLEPLTERNKVIDNGVRAWAPCVVEHEGLYYMYYGPGITKMAVTNELWHWMDHEVHVTGNPVMSVNRDHMVIRAGGRWLMYASGVKDNYSCISLLTSTNLLDWQFAGYALTSSGNAPLNPPWGAFESPYVLEYEGMYYLFVTYTDCSRENYQDMLVFCSPDPCCFGDYTGDNHRELVVTQLHSHAGEVIRCGEKYYLTSAGWRGFGIPYEGGVAIAELRFVPRP